MSKPIEEGCRAVIVNSKAGNNGIKVGVLKYFGKASTYRGLDDAWEIDTTLQGVVLADCVVPEYQLQRIDDYDGDEKTSWEEMKDIWTPEKVGEALS